MQPRHSIGMPRAPCYTKGADSQFGFVDRTVKFLQKECHKKRATGNNRNMKYPIKAANGHAGEFFFAYKIASVLTWPCRLIDIDIGLDAQVEVINDADRTSTGRFVAFQIKAREDALQSYLYVSEEHLGYWREVELPVFVVLVDLAKKKMFLHLVDLNHPYPVTDKGARRIDFDLGKDLFDASSAKRITDAAMECSLAHVKKCLKTVGKSIKLIRDTIADQEGNSDPLCLIELMHQRFNFREQLVTASGLVTSLRVGQEIYDAAESNLEDALQDLRNYMKHGEMNVDWDDDGDIKRFLAEGR